MSRVVVWFSCGAASAVAAKLAVDEFENVEVVYCDTSKSESPDNPRFMKDVENWINQPVTLLSSTKYSSIDDVFEGTRYMAGVQGARCTVEMKKIPRFAFQRPDDIHIFGLTANESERIAQFSAANFDLNLDWILLRHGYTKLACHQASANAGIALPVRYRQGYRNNNCICCVKATSPTYWNMERKNNPEVFERRATLSRELGVKLVVLNGERIFLDELPETHQGSIFDLEDISCGPECK